MLAGFTENFLFLRNDLSLKLGKTLLNFDNFFMNLEHHVRQLTLTVFMLIIFRSEATLVKY